MCAPRSIYSWGIVIEQVGNKFFFDKRDGYQLDLLSVNETSQEVLPNAKEDNALAADDLEVIDKNQAFEDPTYIQIEEAYQTFQQRVIENANVIMATYEDALDLGDVQVYPKKGTMAFSAGLHGWAFTLNDFGKMYACFQIWSR